MKNLLIVVAVMFGFSAFAAGMDDDASAVTTTTKTVKHKHHKKMVKKANTANSNDVDAK